MKKNLHELNCIRVYKNGKDTGELISFNRFYKSYIVERWNGERRYNWTNNPVFGMVYTLNSVKSPSGDFYRTRFHFPTTESEARMLDYNYNIIKK